MSHKVKLLLIALVMALPLRSYAAGAMLLCGTAHQGGVAAASKAHVHEAGTATHAAEHALDTAGHRAAGPEDAGMKLSVCSACGASCTAAIAPPVLGHRAGIAPPSTPIAFLAHPFSGVVLEGAYRPPLNFVR